MIRLMTLACASAMALLTLGGAPAQAEPRPAVQEHAQERGQERAQAHAAAPREGERLRDWVLASGDNNGMPFAVVDKAGGRISVYDADGAPLGSAAALVGAARGDESTPHIGDRELSAIRPAERTTPAGRFIASYGPARDKAQVLWVDYATAISLHPVVTAKPKERRVERLKSPTPADNRITFGCINVPAAFYREVVRPAFRQRGVVYVLPDSKPLEAVLPSFAVYLRAGSESGPA